MKLAFTIVVEQFDAEAFASAIREAIRVVFMKAAQKFLLAAIPRVPQWTGMARGGFKNLEDIVGKVTADAQSPSGYRIRTTRGKGQGRGGGSKDTPLRRGYYYYPPGGGRIARTPEAGRQFSTVDTDIFDTSGTVKFAQGRSAFYFKYEINITYVNYLDEHKWEAFKAGRDAMEEYIKANLELPDATKFTTRKVIKSGE